MNRRLFCEISPFTYRLSVEKGIMKRHVQDLLRNIHFATERTETSLPVLIYRHNSLIRRRLGNVNMQLQENKATNLALAVKHIDGLLIRTGQTFSVWKLIGRTSKRKGYPSERAPAYRTTTSTTASGMTPRTPISSDYGRTTNTCVANCTLQSNSPTPSTSMPRTNTFLVKLTSSIATVKSIVTSSTAKAARFLTANSSAPIMPV